jgi:alanine racemase
MLSKERSWLEIDSVALAHNLGEFRRLVGPERLLAAVVKANAYGHGMPGVARVAVESGADWLAVDSVDEGLALRSAGLPEVPILVMGYAPEDRLAEAVAADLQLTMADPRCLEPLSAVAKAQGRTAAVHLKLETGTHRRGLGRAALLDAAHDIARLPGVRLAGLSTHFANIEDTTDHSFARAQLARFNELVEALAESGVEAPLRHAACSAATILFEQTHFELVRVGISLYGLWSSRETFVSANSDGGPEIALRPAMTWKTRIAEINHAEAGAFVGYGCTFRTTRATRLAVLPVGYYDGYDRGLSNIAHVLVRGQRAPVRGRVCMNMLLVDVTDIDGAVPGDDVVLLGSQGSETVSADQLASWLGTIHYEVVTRIRPGLPRIWSDDR